MDALNDNPPTLPFATKTLSRINKEQYKIASREAPGPESNPRLFAPHFVRLRDSGHFKRVEFGMLSPDCSRLK
jgi:hypothetical protein